MFTTITIGLIYGFLNATLCYRFLRYLNDCAENKNGHHSID